MVIIAQNCRGLNNVEVRGAYSGAMENPWGFSVLKCYPVKITAVVFLCLCIFSFYYYTVDIMLYIKFLYSTFLFIIVFKTLFPFTKFFVDPDFRMQRKSILLKRYAKINIVFYCLGYT